MNRPLQRRPQPGYYPGFSALAQKDFWDDATRALVLARVHQVPPIRFFSPYEEPVARALFERLLPQDDRDEDRRIPILNYIDERLYERRLDGYRFENMPDEPWAHRLGLRGIEAIARQVHGRPFPELGMLTQERVLDSLREGRPEAGHFIWEQMNLGLYWRLIVGDAVSAYYAHPWAWDEIGFGGPAYPRGYMRLENGMREPWEVDEHRYDWAAPEGSPSSQYHPAGGDVRGRHPGQGGNH